MEFVEVHETECMMTLSENTFKDGDTQPHHCSQFTCMSTKNSCITSTVFEMFSVWEGMESVAVGLLLSTP